jgi:ribosome modulation factor
MSSFQGLRWTFTRAFNRGRIEFHAGRARNNCPFRSFKFKSAWIKGWDIEAEGSSPLTIANGGHALPQKEIGLIANRLINQGRA